MKKISRKKNQFTIVMITVILTASCSRDTATFENGYSDRNKLIEDFTEAVFTNDRKKVTELLVNRKEYRELIHPWVPEGDLEHGGIPADEFWRTFIVKRRDAVIDSYLRKATAYRCRLKNIGKTKEIKKYGKVKFHRETEFSYSCKKPGGSISTDTDNHLLGVIAEKGGKYIVLNSFGD